MLSVKKCQLLFHCPVRQRSINSIVQNEKKPHIWVKEGNNDMSAFEILQDFSELYDKLKILNTSRKRYLTGGGCEVVQVVSCSLGTVGVWHDKLSAAR